MINQPATSATGRKRAAYVLILVLIVIVILTLVSFQYTDRTLSESKVANTSMRQTQARLAADAGINYVMALLANPTTYTNAPLNGMLTGNSSAFQGIVVNSDNSPHRQTRFYIVSPVYDTSQDLGGNTGYIYGMIDEGSKINLNAVMKNDPTGKTLYNLLMALPLQQQMTDAIAASICVWLGGTDTTTLANGATDSYYSGLNPPYQGKYGPIDSLEELLLVQGVTPQLLFGNDRNKNAQLDADETNMTVNSLGWPVDMGLSQYITVWGRELNLSSAGVPRVNINGSDLSTGTGFYSSLTAPTAGTPVDEGLATYIVLYRQYGPTAVTKDSSGNPQLPKGSTIGALSSSAISSNTSTTKATANIASIYDLFDTYVAVPSTQPATTDPKTGKKTMPPPTYYACPLTSAGASGLDTLLTPLLDIATTSGATELFGRININTASQELLQALPAKGSTATNFVPAFTDAQIQMIMSTRPPLYSGSAAASTFTTPGWLVTQAGIPPTTMSYLDQYSKNGLITTQTQVYRFQVIGAFDDGGPAARLDVVIDTSGPSPGGMPMLLYRRDITYLGKGFDLSPSQ